MTDSMNMHDNHEIINRLREITPLKFLKQEDIRGLLKSGKMIRYDPGELIIEEGQHSDWIYFLIKGKVGIRKKGETISEIQRRGDIFGEMSTIDKFPRSASIVALDQSVCLAIDASYSKGLKGRDKDTFDAILYRIFAEILSERLRTMDEELVKIKKENSRLRSELERSTC